MPPGYCTAEAQFSIMHVSGLCLLFSVTYVRTHWYGFSYFCRWYGSLIPRSLPAMAIAGAIAGLLEAGIFDESFGWDLTTWFTDPFSMQMFGVVFGYLSISRLTTTYNRYWEGVTHVSDHRNCARTIPFVPLNLS